MGVTDEMGVLEMMIEKDHSWQTNSHLRPRPRSGLAERLVANERTPCQCSAHKRHDYNVVALYKAQMTTAQDARRSCRRRKANAEYIHRLAKKK